MAKNDIAAKAAIGYENIELDGILSCVTLHDLSISEKINEHIQVSLTGYVPLDVNVSLVFTNYEKQTVRIRQLNENGNEVRVLFSGMIQNIEIKNVGDFYSVKVIAVSYTKRMDEIVHSRSIQDKNMLYAEVFELIMKEYDTWRILGKDDSLNQTVDKFILQ